LSKNDDIVYRLDENNRIVHCNSAWNQFAVDNEGSELVFNEIKSQSLWDHIHDSETVHIHEKLLERAKKLNKPLVLPFRCDSENVRRYLEMHIVPLEQGGIEYRCRTIREEERDLKGISIKHQAAGGDVLRMCSWCNRIHVADEDWCELEDAIVKLNIFSASKVVPITHGICESCFKKLKGGD